MEPIEVQARTKSVILTVIRSGEMSMAGDSIGDKIKDLPMNVKIGAGVGVLLVLALVWAWWPEPAPKIDPELQKAAEASKNDKDANPPVPDVPPPTDGPRRKAIKSK